MTDWKIFAIGDTGFARRVVIPNNIQDLHQILIKHYYHFWKGYNILGLILVSEEYCKVPENPWTNFSLGDEVRDLLPYSCRNKKQVFLPISAESILLTSNNLSFIELVREGLENQDKLNFENVPKYLEIRDRIKGRSSGRANLLDLLDEQ